MLFILLYSISNVPSVPSMLSIVRQTFSPFSMPRQSYSELLLEKAILDTSNNFIIIFIFLFNILLLPSICYFMSISFFIPE